MLLLILTNVNRIYHRCFTQNADGTKKTILADERCLVPTAFGSSPRILRLRRLKHAFKQKMNLLWAGKIAINTLKTKYASIDGWYHQTPKFTSWSLQIAFMLFNYGFVVIYCQQWEHFNWWNRWKKLSQKKIQWAVDFNNKYLF